MPRTVKEEMSDEQRTKELLMGLKNTRKEKVFVNFSHLAQVVGMEEADKLAESLTGTTEVPIRRTTQSAMRVGPTMGSLCQIDRVAAVEAIEKKVGASAKADIDEAVKMQSARFYGNYPRLQKQEAAKPTSKPQAQTPKSDK